MLQIVTLFAAAMVLVLGDPKPQLSGRTTGSPLERYWADRQEDSNPEFARQPVQEPAGLKEAESAQKNVRSFDNKAWNEAAWPAYHPYEYQQKQQEQLHQQWRRQGVDVDSIPQNQFSPDRDSKAYSQALFGQSNVGQQYNGQQQQYPQYQSGRQYQGAASNQQYQGLPNQQNGRYWADSQGIQQEDNNIPEFARQPVQEPAGLKEAESAQKNARSFDNKAWNEAAWPAYHPYEYQQKQQEQLHQQWRRQGVDVDSIPQNQFSPDRDSNAYSQALFGQSNVDQQYNSQQQQYPQQYRSGRQYQEAASNQQYQGLPNQHVYNAAQFHGQDDLGAYTYGDKTPESSKVDDRVRSGDVSGSYVYKTGPSKDDFIKVRYWADSEGIHQENNIPNFEKAWNEAAWPDCHPFEKQKNEQLLQETPAVKEARLFQEKAWNKAAWPPCHPFIWQKQQKQLAGTHP